MTALSPKLLSPLRRAIARSRNWLSISCSRKMRAAILTSAFVATATNTAHAVDVTVNLSSNHILEVVFVDLKHGEKDGFLAHDLPQAEKLANKHGGELSAKFVTIDVNEGKNTPQFVLILEWPSIKAADAFSKDAHNDVLNRESNASLRDLYRGLFTIENDVTFTPQRETVYEFFSSNPASSATPDLLGQFFQSVIPIALEYGREDILNLKLVDYKGDNYNRLIFGVAKWPSAEDFYQFTNTTVFREGVVKYRDPAFANLELINTQFIFD